ncbi:hypothetical protein V495_00288 [Pseudogymnoascus sp. VKM F-4514 (FW-929)]|nr:hypothetical protein V495_00288 [Pseudogymnoascus sp. VKM F-4514 (FW-929)]KFY67759.1 hypothetical protein V497_00223 [Pseudogymnoascus sp. VKM F-4516 (FW-969)]
MASAMTDGPPIQCWTCRRKRLVCDSTRPACTKCFKRGTVCPGYGAKPLTWVEPGQKRSSKYENGPAKGENAVEVPEMAIVKPMKPRFRGVDACLSRSFDSQAVLHAIDYYNAMISPDLVPVEFEENPYRFSSSDVRFLPPVVLHTLFSIVFSHELIRRKELQSGDGNRYSSVAVYSHRGLALESLNQDLASPETQTSDMVIACILMFTLAELQLSVCRDWDKHIAGVKKIIELRGGIKKVTGRDVHLDAMLSYFMIIDVMSITTCPPSTISGARSWIHEQEQYLNIIPDIYKSGLSTCFACPTELFMGIIRINQFRAVQRWSKMEACKWPVSSQDILDHVLQFSPLEWVATNLCSQNPATKSGIQSVASTMSGWLSIAEIYHAAVSLYCLGTLSLSIESIESASTICETGMASYSTLKFHLIKIFSATDGTEQMRKLLLWPLVIAGIETKGYDANFRMFITTQLNWMSSALGTFAPIEARQFLESHWRSVDNCPLPKEMQWDLMFDRHYVFVL